jgi:hypothetical protein
MLVYQAVDLLSMPSGEQKEVTLLLCANVKLKGHRRLPPELLESCAVNLEKRSWAIFCLYSSVARRAPMNAYGKVFVWQ